MMNSALKPATGSTRLNYSKEMSSIVASKVAVFSHVFINTPIHSKLYSQLDTLRLLGQSTKGEGQRALRCIAETTSGKTTVARRYRDRQNALAKDGSFPVLFVSIQNSATPKRLLISMLVEFGDVVAKSGTEDRIKRRVTDLFYEKGVELLILDEIHHLAYRGRHPEVVNTLKAFLNDGICPIALLGTDEALPLLKSNKELAQRVITVGDIPRLGNSQRDRSSIRRFLGELDKALIDLGCFHEPSDFIQDDVADKLGRAADGVMGRAARILQVALEHALRRGATRIESFDVSRAIDTWAILQGLCKANPFKDGMNALAQDSAAG